MKLHVPSLMLGYALGAASVVVRRQLRPVLLEAATMAYRFADAVVTRAAQKKEDLEDLLAEARARATELRLRAAASEAA